MNLKRNIFIKALCLIFMLNTFTAFSAFAATEQSSVQMVQEQQASREEQIIKSLGFAKNIPNSDRVSYYEWAQLLLELQGINTNGMTEKTLVDTAIENGYIYSTITAQQKPSDAITIREALYGGVCVLGYNNVYDEEQIVSLALSGGLKKGINQSNDDYVTRDTFFKIAYNICGTAYMELETFKNGEATYTTKNNKTILSEVHGIYTSRGTVTANSLTGLYTSSGAAGTKSVKIDGINYYSGETAAEEMLGRKVKCWYMDHDGDFTLLYIETTDDSDVLTIDANDIDAAATTKTKIVYTINGRNKYKTIKSDAAVIYNGVAYPDFDKTTFSPKTGSVKIINDDVVIIWSYIDFWVNDHNIDKNILTSFYGGEIELSPYQNDISIFDKDMNSKYVIDIRKYSVISIAESADQSTKRILISEDKISGTVSGTSNDGGDVYVVIDGEEYKVSDTYTNSTSRKKTELKIGASVICYLDVFGQICGVESMGGMDNVGYLVNVYCDETDIAWLKLYIPGGKFVTYQCTNKVTFDRKNKVSAEKIPEQFADTNNEFTDGRNIKRQLIKFTLNSDGKISAVDLPSVGKTGESKDSMRLLYNYSTDGGNLFYRKLSASFGGKFLTSSAEFFIASPKDVVPQEKHFTLTSLEDNKTYFVEAYSVNQTGLNADYIVVYPESAVNPITSRNILVNKINEVFDEEEGEVCAEIEGVQLNDSGAKVLKTSFKVDASSNIDMSNIGAGDVLKCGLNVDDKVIKINFVFDYSEKQVYDNKGVLSSGYATNSWGGEYRTMLSSVLAKEGAAFEVRQGPYAEGDGSTEYLHVGNYGGVVVFDENEQMEKAYIGSTDDVQAYEDTDNYSLVLNGTYWGEARFLVIYKREVNK